MKTQLCEFVEFHVDLVEIECLDLDLIQEQHETLSSAISTIGLQEICKSMIMPMQ